MRAYFIKPLKEDDVAGSTVGSGAIAGAGVGPQGAPFLSRHAQTKYKAANARSERKLDMDKKLWGPLAPDRETDAEAHVSRDYDGGKDISHGMEDGYKKGTMRDAPKTHDEHSRKLMRRLLGKE